MTIEEAIQQKKPFANHKQKVSVNLMYTYSWWISKSRAFFRSFDLTAQQYNILRILKGAGKPISTSVIRQRMLDKMSDTPRILERMLKKDLVHKQVCPRDRRLVDVTISQKGLNLLDMVNQKMNVLDGVLNNLNEEEAETLSRLLDKMRG